MNSIKVLDKEFELSLPSVKIQERIRELATEISNDLKNQEPLFIGILNGSFIFASDLFRRIDIDARITFIKLESYDGITTSGKVRQLIGISENLKGMNIVILEDIVDTGNTLDTIVSLLKEYQPASIRVVSLLYKPDASIKDIQPDYIGFIIPDKFVIGYGLDYKGFGRKYEDIYTLMNKG